MVQLCSWTSSMGVGGQVGRHPLVLTNDCLAVGAFVDTNNASLRSWIGFGAWQLGMDKLAHTSGLFNMEVLFLLPLQVLPLHLQVQLLPLQVLPSPSNESKSLLPRPSDLTVDMGALWISQCCLVPLVLFISQLGGSHCSAWCTFSSQSVSSCVQIPSLSSFGSLSSFPTYVIVIDELFGADLALEQTIQNSKVIVAFVIVAF